MKKIVWLLLVLLHLSVGKLVAQNTSYAGSWEVYDTLSVTSTQLGNMVLNKVKLLHKELKLNADGSFFLKHIEPKGFHINADVKGTWKIEGDKLVLDYQDVFEDEKGHRTTKDVQDVYVITENESSFSFVQDGKTYHFTRKK